MSSKPEVEVKTGQQATCPGCGHTDRGSWSTGGHVSILAMYNVRCPNCQTLFDIKFVK